MIVRCESLGAFKVVHDNERRAVSQSPVFVEAIFIELKPALVEIRRERNDRNERIRCEDLDRPDCS